MVWIRRMLMFGAVAGGACTGIGFYISYFDTKVARSARVVTKTVSIMKDYNWTLRKFAYGTPEYEHAMSEAHTRSANKLYDLCCQNKGTYIKMGQLLGALDYILPREYTNILKAFHDDAPQSPLDDVVAVIKKDLNIQSVDEVFLDFSPEPIGTASLAQVHTAVLRSTGEKVAVKVQHPKIREQADFDMSAAEKATRVAAYFFPDFKLIWLAEETRKHLPLELDFLHEARNNEKIAQQMKRFEWIKIPKVHWKHSSHRVLVMEFCEGGQVNDLKYFSQNKINCNYVSQLIGTMFSEMIFVNGFVHCDPHPGNILVRKRSEDEMRDLDGFHGWLRSFLPHLLGGKTRCSEIELVLLDHGLYQTLDDDFRYEYASLWQGLMKADLEKIKKHSASFGVGDLYPLFATMITVRSWDVVVERGVKSSKFSKEEDDQIRTNVPNFLPGISQILNTVPRPMVMLFKANDLMRMLEVLHGTRSDSSGFLNMSRCCLRAVSEHEGRAEIGVRRLRRSLALRMDLTKITLYEWFLWLQATFAFNL